MKSLKKCLVVLVIVMGCFSYTSQAQIYVKIRPEHPRYERPVAPSPRHVWIDEEWEPRGGVYVNTGGHWAEPPREHARWQAGAWHRDNHGYRWNAGHWR